MNLDTYGSSDELYLARGDEVNHNRPIFTGDVFGLFGRWWQFDPDRVGAFLDCFGEISLIRAEHPDQVPADLQLGA